MGETLGSRFDAGHNNFDALRLGAALVVLLSHSYSLTGTPWEPISTWFGYGYGGTLAVAVFFVMSGFLVSRSLESRDLLSFVRGRLLRILPGLAFVTVVETFVIAPLFYEGSVGAYFINFALPHLRNILVFGEDPAIPGVFAKLPFPYVNGSLWTLPVESLFYLLLPFLALAARRRRPVVLIAWALSLAAEPFARWHGLDDEHFGGFLVQTVRLFSVAEFSSYFLAGVAAWTYRDRIPFSHGAVALCLLLLFAAKGGFALPVLLRVCLPYLILFLALHGGAGSRLKRRVGDLSYGLYLFSYPLTNVIIALNPQFSPEVVAGMATVASLAAAWMSWTFVESPALRANRCTASLAITALPRPAWLARLAPLVRPPPHPGNFTALRLFAVGLVVYGNGLLLTDGPPTAYWGAPTSRIGLDLLFATSGYLALNSWIDRPGALGFARRRLVRLLPGLTVCVLLTIAVLGPIATNMPLRAYALNSMTLHYLSNIVLVPHLWLPGVFQGQQWSGAVNPMLWTLSAGLVLWVIIAVLGYLPPGGRGLALALGAGACMALGLLLDPAAGHPLRDRMLEVTIEAPFFLVAALYRQLQDRWPGLWRADLAMLLFGANWISATWLGAGDLALEWVSLPYMAVAFGRMSAPVLGWVGLLGNSSYGFYLYAFPLQQLIVARWPGLTHPVLVCGLFALGAGYLSWHLVERPVLSWGERRNSWPWRPGRFRQIAAPTSR